MFEKNSTRRVGASGTILSRRGKFDDDDDDDVGTAMT
jgi:hypothetical protein